MKEKILILDINSQLKQMKWENLNIFILTDPSIEEIEKVIIDNSFSCIIPLDSKIKNRNNITYDLLKLLEIFNTRYFGNSYLKNIVVREKAAFLKQTGLQIASELWLKTNREKNYAMLNDSDFPIFITCFDNYNYMSYSKNELFLETERLYKNGCNELTIYKKCNFDKFYRVILIGNYPNIIFATDCKDKKEIKYLNEKSKELFYKFKFSDFASFLFVKKDAKYYLLDINLCEILDDTVINLLNENYGLSKYQIIILYAIISISKYTANTKQLDKMLSLIPKELVSEILPLEIKQSLYMNYDYNDLCKELRTRFLDSTDNNKYKFIQLIEKGIQELPVTNANSFCLGNIHFDYENFLSAFEDIPNGIREQNVVLQQSLQILNGQIRWNSPLSFYNICPPTMMNTVAAATLTNMYNPNGMIDMTCSGYLNMEKQIVRQLSTLLDIDPTKSGGVFTEGGKVCLTYGIKCGLNRCQREYASNNSPVIITSEANHFSIEAVGYQLGINKTIRISLNEKQQININEFEKKLRECAVKSIPIAGIVLSGGNTIHSSVDDIKAIKKIIDKYVQNYKLTYVPYIYYDLVVCWPWLFFRNYDFSKNSLKIEQDILKKIKHTSDIFQYAYLADGFGFDFHKGGFCPYTTSTFVTKKREELYLINSVDGSIQKDSCYHTFTNSRKTTDIIAAWNILQSVGAEGFQSYIANMLNVAGALSKRFKHFGVTVLYEKYTFGFATIIWIKSPKSSVSLNKMIESQELTEENDTYIYKFTEYLKRNEIADICVRYLPKYNYRNKSITVLSLLPMTINLDKQSAIEVADMILEIKNKFDKEYINGNNFNYNTSPENVPR